MSTPQPALTQPELERIAMLAEEAGEITQVVGKILRHGYESSHPGAPEVTNRSLLSREISDLSAIQVLMEYENDLISTYGSQPDPELHSELDPEHARVAMLAQCAGRIITIAGDIMLYGMEEVVSSGATLRNDQNLRNELSRFQMLVELMDHSGDLDMNALRVPRDVLRRKLPWTHHQDKLVWQEL